MKLLAVDPGVRAQGWALFVGDRLTQCGLASVETQPLLHDALLELHNALGNVDKLVVEIPQVYQQRHLKGDPNDLIDVAVSVGMVVATMPHKELKLVRPRDWKGTCPKKIHNQRVLALLTEKENSVLNTCGVIPSLRHNVIDAIGIGQWALRRRR